MSTSIVCVLESVFVFMVLREGSKLATEVARSARPLIEKRRLNSYENSLFSIGGHAQILLP
ncbi:hypothetical protein [Flavobacterium restrictum]|uniref:Uncharacterized protein n=1 Tax=Flavobacterium restrictum TaxID=2594428 RepID=A0A553DV68_9FLAO|nr:hypothetical protein [Flavobacterium restrictum]TRX36666.1 hypothetical protein FNW21_13160 [Flavobacterium restrictum]